MQADIAERILQMIRDRGYHVSVFDNPGSLWGTVKAFVEMHAIDLSNDLPVRQTVRMFKQDDIDAHHLAACELARKVGIPSKSDRRESGRSSIT